jgi:hypothetical protein
MVDLNGLIDPASGWTLAAARDINDSGWIVGTGTLNGQARAFLLTPVPEPSSLALLGAAAGGAMSSARRRRPALKPGPVGG